MMAHRTNVRRTRALNGNTGIHYDLVVDGTSYRFHLVTWRVDAGTVRRTIIVETMGRDRRVIHEINTL